jgi:hypothetical protein
MNTASLSSTLLVERKGSKIPSILEAPARGARGSRVAEGDGRRPLALDARAPQAHPDPFPGSTFTQPGHPAPRQIPPSRLQTLLHTNLDLTISVAPGYRRWPSNRHQPRIDATAKAPVS